MSFSRPTLEQIIERNLADAAARVAGVDGTILRRSLLGIIMRQLSGASHELHGHLDWIANQIIPDTAEAEYLDRWSSVWGVTRKAAEFAAGNVTFTGTAGTVIPAGTTIQRTDGFEYTTDASASLDVGGSATVAVTCSTAGDDANTEASTAMTLLQPVAGVNNTVTVATGGITGGADPESDELLRGRLLDRISQPPNGGSSNDYEQWALEVAGVTRAWVFPQHLGPGTVGVAFVRDNDSPIFPDGAEVTAVQTYIDNLRPVTADVTVFAPVALTVPMTIAINPNTGTVQAAIEAELEDLFMREAAPDGTIPVSHVREAISIAAGEYDHNLVTPTADIVQAANELAVLGAITWQTL